MRVWQPLTALKIFLSFSVVLYWLGPAVFILQQGRFGPVRCLLAVAVAVQLFSSALGGVSKLLLRARLGFSRPDAFHSLESETAAWRFGLVLHSFLVVLLFFWNLSPLIIYGVLAGCYFLSDIVCRWRDRKWTECRTAPRGGRSDDAARPLVLLALYLTAGHSQQVSGHTFWHEWAENGVVNVLSRKVFCGCILVCLTTTRRRI